MAPDAGSPNSCCWLTQCLVSPTGRRSAILACFLAFARGVSGTRPGQQQGAGSGRIPYQVNDAAATNGLLCHRTLRLPPAEEVEHPLGKECGGVRVIRRQRAVGEQVLLTGI